MSQDVLHHKNSLIAWALPRLLAIIDTSEDGCIPADSEAAAARECASRLHRGRKLARSVNRREARMKMTIGAAKTVGLVRFSPQAGLRLTDKGKSALARWRESSGNNSVSPEGRAHGRQYPLPIG
ncbi:MAG TPA: hypothetical protein PL051_00040 [Candidatus Saccharibacteria bacterium]|nr:hypothetical protein [Candidatus Saccharibacteria bacterium]